METPLDLLIVGAGPAGIAAGVEARLAGFQRIQLLEKGPRPSWSIQKLYAPGKRVDRAYLGQDAPREGALDLQDCSKDQCLALLDQALAEHRLPVECDTEVWKVHREEDGLFTALDSKDRSWRARAVVLAIGVYGRPNKPGYPVPGSLKAQIHYDLNAIPAGSKVLVIGGGNTALEYADFLHRDHDTTLAYRGAEFLKANDVNRGIVARLAAEGKLRVWMEADVESLADAGEAPKVEARFKAGAPEAADRFDHLVYAIGGSTPEAFLQAAGAELHGKAPVVDGAFQSTVPGLYLAGDLIAGGKGSIIKAFNSAHRIVALGLGQDPAFRPSGTEGP
ncbi:MAG TPA: NAD(P)-binding domain-containing protein [Holophagaceae bacterium]|nr:NAD(P)-binding domain-containing protein [Holophagaceae bacterium]